MDRSRNPPITMPLRLSIGCDRAPRYCKALVYGWSMGGVQAYHWATLYPQDSGRSATGAFVVKARYQ